jgi:hypothetical protein
MMGAGPRLDRRQLLAALASAALASGADGPAGEAFARRVRELSGPETGPAGADNLMTNEDSFPRVCGDVARRTPKEGVYVGVGPDQNFTYIAHARPRLAFVLDHRRRNLLLHLVHKALFSLSPGRSYYLARLTARRAECPADADAEAVVAAFDRPPMDRALLEATVAEVARALRPLGLVADEEWPALATIQSKLAGPGLRARFLALPTYPTLAQLIRTTDRDGRPAHFLAREDLYQAARRVQLEDRVIPLVGDFAGPEVLPRLGDWLRARDLPVSLLYISDVEFFLLRSGRFPAYVANLARLPWADGALLVRTSTREIDHPARVAGDHATTIARPVAPFLERARAGRIPNPDDLFAD